MKICRLFNRSYRSNVRDDVTLRNLDLIALSAAFGCILFANAGGAALTGYASAFGAGELMFGLMSALPILASLMQLFVSYMIERTGNPKALFLIGGITHRTIWVLTSAIPLVIPDRYAPYRIWALLAMITIAAMGGAFTGVTHTAMIAEVVPIDIRGRYMTTRQRLAIIFSMLSGLGASFILDHFTGFSGYSFVFLISGLAGLVDVLMYVKFKFPAPKKTNAAFSMTNGFREFFRTKKTRDYLIFYCVWSFAINISAPFFTKYSIDILKLSFIQIIIFGQITANIASIMIVKRWGRFIDRYGCVPLMLLTGTATSILTLVWMPAAVGSFVPILIFNIFGGFFWSANEACAINMQLSHTPDIGRPLALATFAVTTSFTSAIAFISGGAFLEWAAPVMASLRITVFGTPFDHYKLLFLIATAFRLASVFVFLPRVWNEKGLTTRGVYAEIYHRGVYRVRMLRVAVIVIMRKRRMRLRGDL